MKNKSFLFTILSLFVLAAFTIPALAQSNYGYSQNDYGYSNENIINGVQEALRRQPGLDPSAITVWLQNRVVYLSGEVDSQRARELAADAAHSVRGVRDVDTQDLQVIGFQSAGNRSTDMYGGVDDRSLQNRVERALRRSQVDLSGLNVEVNNGQVHLFGTVPSREAANTAVAVAHSVEGVNQVNSYDLRAASDYSQSQMQQRGYYSPQENQLRDRVYSALQRTPNIDASKIDVRVKGDSVYLSGRLDSQEQKNIAHSVVHSVDGVRNVYANDLKAY